MFPELFLSIDNSGWYLFVTVQSTSDCRPDPDGRLKHGRRLRVFEI